jgi:hypothetical protein
MDKVYFAEKALAVNRTVTMHIGGRAREKRTTEMLDGLIGVTVMSVGAIAEKTEFADRNQTLIVSLANARQTRRITAFGDKNIKLFETIGVGDVIEAYGLPIYNRVGTTGTNGMSVEAVHVLEHADADKAAATTASMGNSEIEENHDFPIDLD